VAFIYSNEPTDIVWGTTSIKIVDLKDRKESLLLDNVFCNLSPSWGSEGKEIYYRSDEGGEIDIWAVPLDEGERRRVTNDTESEVSPIVSPDGKWVLFTQKTEGIMHEVFIVPASGGEKVRLTHTENFLNEAQSPAWFPDSERIAFFSFLDLVVIDLKGERLDEVNLAGLNNFSELVIHPAGGGNVVVFKARPAQAMSFNPNLYALSLKEKELTLLEGVSFWDQGLDISPDGKYIVYASPEEKCKDTDSQ
jgi:Tol biopolymer transport system component